MDEESALAGLRLVHSERAASLIAKRLSSMKGRLAGEAASEVTCVLSNSDLVLESEDELLSFCIDSHSGDCLVFNFVFFERISNDLLSSFLSDISPPSHRHSLPGFQIISLARASNTNEGV
jgi:hypothetical protein